MEKHISSAEAKARFRAVLDDVVHHGERYVVERHGEAVAAIVRVEELDRLPRKRPAGAGGNAIGAMALVGLWHGVSDEEVDSFIADIHESRAQDTGRAVEIES